MLPARWVFVGPPRSVHSAARPGSLARAPLNPVPGPSDGTGVRVPHPWSEPWNGEGGTSGSSVQLGSVEWTANAPTRAYITIHRCLVTRAGRARGVEPADLLRRVLALAGLAGSAAPADLAGADPR